MGCLQSSHNVGLYDDHELLDNLNFDDDENTDMQWEDDALIAAADDIVGSTNSMGHVGNDRRPGHSRILTNEEIQRITRDKMAQIVAEQEKHDAIVDAALAQADEDQRLEEEAEVQSMRLKQSAVAEKRDDGAPFRGSGDDDDDEAFDDFLENVKSKSLNTKAGSGMRDGDAMSDTGASLQDTSFHDAETFDEFVGSITASPNRELVEKAAATTATEVETRSATNDDEKSGASTVGSVITTLSLDQELPDLDLPDLLQNVKIAASNTDFSFAE